MLKQLRYFFMMLLLAIVGNVSAQEVSWDLSNGEWTIDNGSVTNGEVTFTGAGADNFKFNTGYFMMGKKDAYITLPAFDFDVEVIEVVGRSGASANTLMNVFVGEIAVSTETKGCVNTNIYQIAKDYQAAGTVYTLKVTSAHNAQITAINIYKKGEAPVTVTPPTITPNGGEVESGSKVQIAFDGALLYYTTDGSEPSMSNANAVEVSTSPATITITEGVTIKAIAYDDEDNPSDVVSATFTVKDPNAEEAGTEDNPYTVEQAIAAIDAGTGTQGVYATGIVSAIPTAYSTQYNNITFNMVDEEGDEEFLQAYRCDEV